MAITQLQLLAFRNISELYLDLHPKINLFWGSNGSGKTSLLEALYMLGHGGRSFRTHRVERVIQHQQPLFRIFARYNNEMEQEIPVGIEREGKNNTVLRLNGKTVQTAVDMARVFPMQIINPQSFRLLEAGPEDRRRFMDWGVFHVEHDFLNHWQQVKRGLQQRNAALRQGLPTKAISVWDESLSDSGEKVRQYRETYFHRLLPIFQRILAGLGGAPPFTLTYYSGWSKEHTLLEALQEGLAGDRLMGYTRAGPHRSDIRIRCGVVPAKEILSRGQEKLVVLALHLARGQLYEEERKQGCIYLLDDLAAELDNERQRLVVEGLLALRGQLFITSLGGEGEDEGYGSHSLWNFAEEKGKMFHVEHGTVSECALKINT